MAETETVGLNLDGSFAAAAEKDAAAADKLGESLDKLANAKQPGGGLEKVSEDLKQQAALAEKILNFDAARVRQNDALAKHYQKMREDALGITAANEKAAAAEKAAADAAERKKNADKAARSWAEREKALAANAEANEESSWADMSAAGKGVAAAGYIILHAAEKLLSAAVELTKAGVALSVEQTTKKEIQGGALGALGGNYEQTVHMALKMGMDPDQAVAETKKLLNAKFASTEIPQLLRIKAGMDLEGLDGDALLKKLETIQLGSKVGTKDVEGLRKLGVDVGDVYKQIAASTGKSMDQVKAAVKAGTMDATQVVDAIEKVTGDKFGTLADKVGNSVPALVARVKGDLLEMFAFDPQTLEPIKAALKTVAEVLEGPDGAALKKSLSEVFTAFAGLFKGIDKEEVKGFARVAAQDFHKMADAIIMAGPALKDAAHWIALMGLGALDTLADAMLGAAYWARELDNALKDPIGTLEHLADAALQASGTLVADLIAGTADALQGFEDEFQQAGVNMAVGLAEGIASGASAAIDAATSMAEQALQAAKDALGIHSPSEEFGDAGDMSAEGYANKLEAHPGPAQAAAGMADKAIKAANDNAGPPGAGAGAAEAGAGAEAAGGAVSVTVNLNLTFPPGTDAAAVKAVLAQVQPEIEAAVRRAVRAQREGGRGLAA